MQQEEEGFFDKFFPFGQGNNDGRSTAPSSNDGEAGPKKWQKRDESKGSGPGKGGYKPWSQNQGQWKRDRDANRWDSQEDGKAELEQELKELKEQLFLLQRLALRQEDLLAAVRPEMCFVMFTRIDVGASIVPSIYTAQAAWRELKANEPEKLNAPMRVDLLRCIFKELKARMTALMNDESQQKHLVQMEWLMAEPVSWCFLRWDANAGKHRKDESKSPMPFERVMAIIEAVLVLVQKNEVVTRFHPSRPVEAEMKGKSMAFTIQLAMMNDDARTLRQHLNDLSGLAATQLLAMSMRPERPGRSALANLVQKGILKDRS